MIERLKEGFSVDINTNYIFYHIAFVSVKLSQTNYRSIVCVLATCCMLLFSTKLFKHPKHKWSFDLNKPIHAF